MPLRGLHLCKAASSSSAPLLRIICFGIHGKAQVIDRAGTANACVARVPCVLDGQVGRGTFVPINSKQWNGLCHSIVIIDLCNDLQVPVSHAGCVTLFVSGGALYGWLRRSPLNSGTFNLLVISTE